MDTTTRPSTIAPRSSTRWTPSRRADRHGERFRLPAPLSRTAERHETFTDS
ncbi:hypothetical protein ACGH7X_33790 [Streptomyces sp. BBFR51]|uniref:hypothetical protein n=1 Tax=Streptomyces sp. BBFR51 TaxID=3372856 RepID=UPI0037DCF479